MAKAGRLGKDVYWRRLEACLANRRLPGGYVDCGSIFRHIPSNRIHIRLGAAVAVHQSTLE
jgi:hypothetical protein